VKINFGYYITFSFSIIIVKINFSYYILICKFISFGNYVLLMLKLRL